MVPPPVEIHKELIPKNIDIVRVYYPNSITGPDRVVPFDFDGSGFTSEFQKMIQVESGGLDVQVRDLTLVTPNQIHGMLAVNAQAKTGVIFPQILIQGKVVFRAEDPFAVIRPNEVLNFVFTEMGESGHSGRWRIYTNLTPEMYDKLSVVPSSSSIQISELAPSLPFVVDGSINIGPTVGGDYGVTIKLGDKEIWKKDGIIRVVRPTLGQTGLIQRVKATEAFHRPGDGMSFVIQGSGFQEGDVKLLQASVLNMDVNQTTFTYVAPGRIDLAFRLPLTVSPSSYAMTIFNGKEVLNQVDHAFTVVDKNWIRSLKVDSPLVPGGQSVVTMDGRDLDKDFVSSIKIEVDEPSLEISSFTWVGAEKASASISAGPSIAPGDYLLKLTSRGKAILPQEGSIIRINQNK
jgi:hypothetical protein